MLSVVQPFTLGDERMVKEKFAGPPQVPISRPWLKATTSL